MSELYKRIEALCKNEGITITEMCRRAGVPRANLTELKMGRQQTLGLNSLARISAYFNVSVESLVNPSNTVAETEKAPASEETGASEEAVRYSLFNGHEVSDETYQKVLAFARFALEEERRQKGE